MAVVHVLPGVANPEQSASNAPDPEIVTICEDLLTLAREGRIRQFAYAHVDNRGRTSQGWSVEESMHALAASVSYLQHRMCAMQIAEFEPADMPSGRPPA